ncbi:MAG: hypothetical protein AAB536_03655 [Patescibacteria group bacterium]
MHEDYKDKKIRLDDYGDGSGPKSSRWKFYSVFLVIISATIALYVVVNQYGLSGAERNTINSIDNQQVADVYGGKTPLETLQMHIDAIQKGDYELASRYFDPGDQGQEFKLLAEATAGEIANYLSLLKSLDGLNGVYSSDGKTYSIIINEKASVKFIAYSSGVWKIKS